MVRGPRWINGQPGEEIITAEIAEGAEMNRVNDLSEQKIITAETAEGAKMNRVNDPPEQSLRSLR